MRIFLHKNFEKQFARLPIMVKQKFKERRDLFLVDPSNPILKNHSVDRAYPGWRSINITGDYRVLYEPKDEVLAVFMKIGTHAQLYG